MILGDFHMHTTHSDGKLPMRDLVDFYGQRGFGAIAITDHLCEEKSLLGKAAAYLERTLKRESFQNYIEEINQEAERAWMLYEMLVLPGFEITKNTISNHRSAHILALGVEDYIQADQDVEEICYQIRAAGGVSVAAHPISKKSVRGQNYFLWDRRKELRSHFDAWEVTDNGLLIPEVTQTNLPKLASSDLHKPRHINSWKTILNCRRDPHAILDAIRDQQIYFRYYSDAALNLQVA